jgi:hypothetical protein
LKLEFDTGVILQQLKLFTNACSMVEQVLMQKRGGDKTETEILEELGKSYASRDFKKNIETQIEHKLESYTFHLPYFDAFEAAYKAEVKNLESKKK